MSVECCTVGRRVSANSVIYGIESIQGHKGMIIDAYGVYSDEHKAAFIVLRLCEEADFGALNCQHTTKVDARQNVQLTTEPAFLQNRC